MSIARIPLMPAATRNMATRAQTKTGVRFAGFNGIETWRGGGAGAATDAVAEPKPETCVDCAVAGAADADAAAPRKALSSSAID